MAENKLRISVESNQKAVTDLLMQQLADVQKNLQKEVFKAMTLLERQIVDNIRKNAGLQVRTGKLMNSIGASKKVTIESDGSVTGEIGPQGVPYAAIHEYGGTIVPKTAGALTIPTSENRRPDGLPRVPTNRLSSRAFARNGILFDVDGTGNSQRLTPMFILKDSVTIPARPYLAPALAAKREEILKEFGVFLAMSFSKGAK